MTDHNAGNNKEDEKKKNSPGVLSYRAMRGILGLLGFLLPLVLLIGGMWTEGHLRDSISSFYHSPSALLHGFFVGTLCAMGIFLVSYRGYEKEDDEHINDNVITSVGGFSIIFVALFPVVPWCPDDLKALLQFAVHYGSAGVFFLAMAFMSFYKFTRPPGSSAGKENSKAFLRKKCRNKIYRTCAYAIILSISLIPLKGPPGELFDRDLDCLNWVFWLESLALLAFSVSWSVKGYYSSE